MGAASIKRNGLLVALAVAVPGQVFASAADEACKGANPGSPPNVCNETGLVNLIGTIVNTLLFIAGALAVIVIIFGGILYVTSTGDSKRIEQAKNTIFYAVAGLIVTVLAYAIVNFVLGVF